MTLSLSLQPCIRATDTILAFRLLSSLSSKPISSCSSTLPLWQPTVTAAGSMHACSSRVVNTSFLELFFSTIRLILISSISCYSSASPSFIASPQ